jgi:hypothetical protein
MVHDSFVRTPLLKLSLNNPLGDLSFIDWAATKKNIGLGLRRVWIRRSLGFGSNDFVLNVFGSDDFCFDNPAGLASNDFGSNDPPAKLSFTKSTSVAKISGTKWPDLLLNFPASWYPSWSVMFTSSRFIGFSSSGWSQGQSP